MKKNTLAKWMLAGAAMVVAFACQPKNTPDTSSQDDSSSSSSSSCPCNTGCSSLVAPVATEDKTAMNAVEKVDETSEEVSTYVIEIEDAEEVASSTDKVEVPAVVEAPVIAQDATPPPRIRTTTQTSTDDTEPNPTTKVETTTRSDSEADKDSDNDAAESKTTTTTKTSSHVRADSDE